MKVWETIESLAEDMGISTRTGWRWLRDGKVQKKREDGQIVFALVEKEPTDTTDTLTTDTDNYVSSDMSVDVSDSDFVSKKKKVLKNRRISQTPIREGPSSLVQGLRDELESAKIEFEVEKLQDARERWNARKNKEHMEEAEEERMLKLAQFEMAEAHHQEEDEHQLVRKKIQRAKSEALEGLDKILLSAITANILQEIESQFLKLKVDEIPVHELVTMAEAIRDKVFQNPLFVNSVRESLLKFAWQTHTQLLKNQMRKIYKQTLKQGTFNGSYTSWLVRLANRYPEDDQKSLFEMLL
ncbi:MAG: hypothetical protein A2Y81_13270 [Nitrospirae bacterium RBG_13_43_8]|nr:MAG: hypothetical protein A2Y81_13270 [Nitrospirae bacterium RBG_13_43_8]